MMAIDEIPGYLANMVRRVPPSGAPVVPGSTPVVSFGDPRGARVATLGINPSRVEFVTDGKLLAGDERRLATLESLGAEDLVSLSHDQVTTVVRECATYFRRNPYRRWFNKLETVLQAVGFSYFDGSACHLDLSQWATDPVWTGIADAGIRGALLADGVPHLEAQLHQEDIDHVFVNGRSVLDQVSEAGLATFQKVGTISTSAQRFGLYAGEGRGHRWLGWSANLQGSAGIGADFLDELSTWVADELGERPGAQPVPRELLDADGSLPQGVRVSGKRALVDLLEVWLQSSDAPTVGDVGSFGRKSWIHAQVGGHQVVVNADTTRAAVEQVVATSRASGLEEWSVTENAKGKPNKVLPWTDRTPLPGWYAYVTDDLAEPGRI